MNFGIKIINAIASIILAGGFVFIIFFTTFYKLPIQKWQYFTLNYTFIVIGLYYLLQSLFGIINNRIYIPRLKKKATNLPMVAILKPSLTKFKKQINPNITFKNKQHESNF